MLLCDTGFSPEISCRQPENSSLVYVFDRGRALLCCSGGEYSTARFEQIRRKDGETLPWFCLGVAEGKPVYCPDPLLETPPLAEDGLCWVEMKISRGMGIQNAPWLYTAWHLWSWYRKSRFCGVCGGKTEHAPGERAVRCPKCGQMFFPTIAPAVIIAITSGDYLLQVSTTYGEKGRFSLVAGYVEAGETLEHAVRREAMEEVGLTLDKVEYLGDQPWGFSGTQMFGFHATADKEIPLRLQESEIAAARWVHRRDLMPGDNPVSVSATLMRRFASGEW